MPVLIPLFIFGAVFFMIMTLVAPREEVVRERLRAAVAETLPRSVRLRQPFSQRIVLPALLRVGVFIARYAPARVVERTRQQLIAAGLWKTDPLIFLAVRVTLGGGLVLFMVGSGLALRLGLGPFIAALAVVGLVGYYGPVAWLRGRVRRRQEAISRRFPDALDLLTVCVEAGLGLDQALEKVAERSRGPLGEEIHRYLDEVRLGKDRLEALRGIATRTGVPELHSFVTTLTQAMNLGVSIADVLRVQADFARTSRRQRIEERAMKAPIKVLFPLIFFLFPAIFVALAGPAAIHLFTVFFR